MQFQYLEPKTIQEALSLLRKHKGKAKPIAGGTDLLLQIRSGKVAPEYVVDIGGIGLDYIKSKGRKGLAIGALTVVRSLEKSPLLLQNCPILSQAAGQLASVAIRGVGTVGGNLCNASPSAETAPALIALGSRVRIARSGVEREMEIENFFTGPGATALKPGELLIEIQVPSQPAGAKGIYLKHAHRGTIDLAMVGVAVLVTFKRDGETCEDIRIALGAVAPTPIRARQAEELLKGKKIDEGLIDECARTAAGESRPISDVRSSAEYRREMVGVLTRRALRNIISQ